MCVGADPIAPSDAASALALIDAGLGYLGRVDATGLGSAGQAEALVALERAEARHTAARARILAAFDAGGGYEVDGHYGPKPWLRAVTRVTKGAATGAIGWVRRLGAHPALADALAAGEISASWAREICGWTDELPEAARGDADAILLAAAGGGAELSDLAALAVEMRDRCALPDQDDDGFADRSLQLDVTMGGAGALRGDLTAGCAAALSAVLDALSGKAGPEDTRSFVQRRHDALEEACHRLIGAHMLPGRDGQPVHLLAHIDLAALRGLPGASALEAEWCQARAGAAPGSWYLSGPEAEAMACDATIVPVVTGRIDWTALDQLTGAYLQAHGLGSGADGGGPGNEGGRLARPAGALSPAARQRLQDSLLRLGADLVSGPGGLASYLRSRLLGRPYTGTSQVLDMGAPTAEIPPHLRRAVILRDRHCSFPGCWQPPAACQVHHLIPRSKGGKTALGNLKLLCRFHHLIAIHRWGWTLTCHPDGTTTAAGPGGRTLHSHGPPGQAA
jgi:Domain of unknown function (DUF222)/HNH endonuclease